MSHCRATWPLCILRGRPAVASLQTGDRAQRRVFDCGQGETLFALRKGGSREEGMHMEDGDRWRETEGKRKKRGENGNWPARKAL